MGNKLYQYPRIRYLCNQEEHILQAVDEHQQDIVLLFLCHDAIIELLLVQSNRELLAEENRSFSQKF